LPDLRPANAVGSGSGFALTESERQLLQKRRERREQQQQYRARTALQHPHQRVLALFDHEGRIMSSNGNSSSTGGGSADGAAVVQMDLDYLLGGPVRASSSEPFSSVSSSSASFSGHEMSDVPLSDPLSELADMAAASSQPSRTFAAYFSSVGQARQVYHL
jgi:hypothetical protein